MYALEMAYDDAWAERGPGQMLLLFSMHEAIERRARSYNLLTSFAYYKARWGAHIVDAEALQLFRVGSFHFYKAIFGDFRRRVLEGIVPSEAEARRAYNATRRKVEPPHDDEALHAPSDALAALRARGEGLRFWSKDALAALLPFKTT
jgi:hypothetical protein